MARVYTDEQHAWIREHFAAMTNAELAEAFNAEFRTSLATKGKMVAYGKNHGLHKEPGVKGRALRKYTDEQLGWLRGYIPGHHEQEIIDAYAGRYGERLTVSMVANLKTKLGIISGTVGGQFRRGHEPPNKGKTWDELGITQEKRERMLRTAFKPGQTPHNAYRALLDEKTDQYGTWVYVRPRNRRYGADDWVSKQRFVWMQHYGREWPEGCRAVFADRDSENFDPENIVPVPGEIYVIVTGGAHGHALPWHDRETLEVAITHAKLIRKRRELELAPRECGCCGRTFEPYYPHQRTCRQCLDKGLTAPRRRRAAQKARIRDQNRI